MKLSSKWFVADFETTGIKFYKENGYTKVWLWAVCDDKSNIVKYGSDIKGMTILAIVIKYNITVLPTNLFVVLLFINSSYGFQIFRAFRLVPNH